MSAAEAFDADDGEGVDPRPVRDRVDKLKRMGLTQSEIARRAGVPRWAVSELVGDGWETTPPKLANAIMAIDHDTRQGEWTAAGECRTDEAHALAAAYGLDNPTGFYFPPEWADRELNTALSELADTLCERCPVRVECIAYAVENDVLGRWGGTDERDRKQIKRGSK